MFRKFISLALAAALMLSCSALAEGTDTTASATTSDDAYMAQWCAEHGYVKMEADAISSATDAKVGGVNFGAIEWDTELQTAAVKEFLKGGKYLGDAAWAQDETGNNYREMYQLATSYNNIPTNTNLEMVLDASTLHLLGVSEAGTSKTIHFQRNPYVSVSWVRQIRPSEEEVYNYYCSYGVEIDGTVRVYTAADLETEEGQSALLNLFDKYYPTLASTWMGYGASLAGMTDEAAIREAKLAYITKTVSSGAMIAYEIIPNRIVITAPFLMNLVPQMMNGAMFTQIQEGDAKYAYTLGLSEEFLDKLVAFKAAYIGTEEGAAAVADYYSTGMYPMLDGVCAQYGMPTSLEYAMMDSNACGMKTQTTYVPAE